MKRKFDSPVFFTIYSLLVSFVFILFTRYFSFATFSAKEFFKVNPDCYSVTFYGYYFVFLIFPIIFENAPNPIIEKSFSRFFGFWCLFIFSVVFFLILWPENSYPYFFSRPTFFFLLISFLLILLRQLHAFVTSSPTVKIQSQDETKILGSWVFSFLRRFLDAISFCFAFFFLILLLKSPYEVFKGFSTASFLNENNIFFRIEEKGWRETPVFYLKNSPVFGKNLKTLRKLPLYKKIYRFPKNRFFIIGSIIHNFLNSNLYQDSVVKNKFPFSYSFRIRGCLPTKEIIDSLDWADKGLVLSNLLILQNSKPEYNLKDFETLAFPGLSKEKREFYLFYKVERCNFGFEHFFPLGFEVCLVKETKEFLSDLGENRIANAIEAGYTYSLRKKLEFEKLVSDNNETEREFFFNYSEELNKLCQEIAGENWESSFNEKYKVFVNQNLEKLTEGK